MSSIPIYTYITASSSDLVHERELKQIAVDKNKQKKKFLQSSTQTQIPKICDFP
jgi:hypothetical protein